MGEMLGKIAHQWRQPLSRLGFILMNIESKDKEQKHSKKLEEAFTQLEFMSQTIDDFRNFYKPNKEKESFSLEKETRYVLDLLHLKEIEVILTVKDDIPIVNYKNEYRQVVLNLLSNAKDALIERAVAMPKIMIGIEGTQVSISDNAGGINLQEIEKIYEPYFTTKEKGLGIGLYIAKVIVEKNMAGSLKVINTVEGAKFIITL